MPTHNDADVRLALLLRCLRVPAATVAAAKGRTTFIEMFAGSCTMSAAAHKLGCECTISFDALEDSPATVKCDLRDPLHMTTLKAHLVMCLSQGVLPIGHQSPPCNQVSRAATRKDTRDLAKTAAYLITAADLLAPCVAWTVENPESEYGLFRMVDPAVLEATKAWNETRPNPSGQAVTWPSPAQLERIRVLLRHQVGVFYCSFGSKHPKPTRFGVSCAALKRDLLGGGNANKIFRVSYDEVFRVSDCPHGGRSHACNGAHPGASIPMNLAIALVKGMRRVAEAKRGAVVRLLTEMEAMTPAELRREYDAHLGKVAAFLPDAGVSMGLVLQTSRAEPAPAPTPEPAMELMAHPESASVYKYATSPQEDQHSYERYDRVVLPLRLLRNPRVSARWLDSDAKLSQDELLRAFDGFYFHVGTDSYGGLLTSIALTHRAVVEPSSVRYVGAPCGLMRTLAAASQSHALVCLPRQRVLVLKVPKHECPELDVARRVVIGEDAYFTGCRSKTLEACGTKATSCDDPIPEYAGRSGALHIPHAIAVDADVLRVMRGAARG